MPAFNQLDPTKHTRAMDNLTFGQCVREVVARREEIRETCERHRGRVQRLGQLMLDTHEEIRIAETRNLIFTKNHRQPDMAPTQPSMSEDEDPEIEAEYERCSRQSAIINTQGFPDKLVKLLQDSEKAERYQKALWKPNEERSQVLQYLVRRYIWQIRYGCRNKQCKNPHCFSSNRPTPTEPPIRRPTFYTARMMAYTLATRDRPLDDLCGDPPSIQVKDLTKDFNIDPADMDAFLHEWFRLPWSAPSAAESEQRPFEVQMNKFHPVIDGQDLKTATQNHPEMLYFGSSKPRQTRMMFKAYIERICQDRRDRKSLVQNLLGSCTSRAFEVLDPSFTHLDGFSTPCFIPPHSDQQAEPAPRIESPASVETGKTEPDPQPQKLERRTSLPLEGHVAPKLRPPPGLEKLPKKQDKESSRRGKERRKSSHGSQVVPTTIPTDDAPIEGLTETSKAISPTHALSDSPLKHKSIRTEEHPRNKSQWNGPPEGAEALAEASSSRSKNPAHPHPLGSDPKSSKSILRNAPGLIVFTGPSLVAVRDELLKADYNDFLMLPAQSLEEGLEPYWFRFPNPTRKPEMALNTVNHALQASLSSWPTLLKCFRESPGVDSVYKTPNKCSLSYFRAVEKANCFSMWPSLNGSLILDSLWHPLRALYNPPSELSAQGQRSPKLRAQSRSSSFSAQPSPQTATRPPRSNVPSGRYLTDEEAAHIIMVCLQAMFGRGGIMQTWLGNKYFYEGRALGRTYAVDSVQGKSPDIGYIDEIDHEPTRRLFRAVVRALGVRRCFDEIAKTTGKSEATPARSPNPLEIEEEVHSHCKVLKLILEYFVVGKKDLRKIPCQDGVLLVAKASPSARRHIAYVYTFIDMLQSIILYEWDGKAELHRWSPVGAAIDILADIYKDRDLWGIPAERFAMQYIPNRLDPISTPLSYISWNRTPNTSHLLSFPFLFPKPIITAYFRTVTFSSLSNAYNAATYTKNLFEKWGHEVSHESDFPDAHENRQDYLESRMSRAMTRMLYLDCKRGTVLQDAFTQLWGRELRELKRPLKVQLGFGEGEEGLDHGGVSQEFFGVVFGPAFVEDAGLFVTDKRSQMTYFRPLSPASLDHFELVGLLVGLALYNGCTIPINFPQAVYRKLLGQPVDRIEHIKDGWQELAQGFEQLLLWGSRPGQEEDVSEVFMREYIYTFDCISGPVDVDMNAIDRDKVWPDLLKEATESVAIMVDNSNRKRYVQDYIYWMIHKSVEPAYEAFEDGFYTVIDRRAVSMLSPEHLAVLMAGHSNLSAIGLYRAATYEEGYSRYHQTILDFWQIVMAFDEKKLRRLLEFVTACDRVPVNGIEDVAFCIVRNGSDSDRIPQSMTCYGKLLLPQYDSKAKLNEKLNVALENSLGFGAA